MIFSYCALHYSDQKITKGLDFKQVTLQNMLREHKVLIIEKNIEMRKNTNPTVRNRSIRS